MGVNQELWQRVVKEQLFKDNAFLNAFLNRDEYVLGGAVVHIPQAGAASGVVRNRSSLPAAVTTRTDTDVTYSLDEFTTNPIKLSDRERVELSYDKMQSFMRQDTGNLMEVVAEWLLYNAAVNAPAASKIATTGANATTTAPGATGDRKVLTKEDMLKAFTLLNTQNVPKENRYIVLDSNHLDQLLSDNDLYTAYERTAQRETGALPKLFGFNIYERSTALVLDNAQDIKNPDAASATTDTVGALFFQTNYIERALGDIRVFDDMNAPTYYGDIISFLIRAQARANRTDNKGYGVIYNAPAA